MTFDASGNADFIIGFGSTFFFEATKFAKFALLLNLLGGGCE
jgi:hypothetical protein